MPRKTNKVYKVINQKRNAFGNSFHKENEMEIKIRENIDETSDVDEELIEIFDDFDLFSTVDILMMKME
jgi:hypothetical protein